MFIRRLKEIKRVITSRGRTSKSVELNDLNFGGQASVKQGLEDLDPDVFMLLVSHSDVHVVDHAGNNLLGVAHNLEVVVVVSGLVLNRVLLRHEEFE